MKKSITDKRLSAEEMTEQDWANLAGEKGGISEISTLISNYLYYKIDEIPQPAWEDDVAKFLSKKFQELHYPKKSTLALSVKIMGYPSFKGSVVSPIDDSPIELCSI